MASFERCRIDSRSMRQQTLATALTRALFTFTLFSVADWSKRDEPGKSEHVRQTVLTVSEVFADVLLLVCLAPDPFLNNVDPNHLRSLPRSE